MRSPALWGILATDAPVIIKQLQILRIQGANYEPGGREFESLRARQIPQLNQALTTFGDTAFCFNKTIVGILWDRTAQTLFAASIKFSNSAAE